MLELYKSCYQLDGEPFRLSPDQRFSFAHRSYANARAYLEYALCQEEGFIAVTGAAGTGKTTLIKNLLEEVDRSRTLVATLTSAQLDLDHLIMLVIRSFGLQVQGDSIGLSLMELDRFLVQRVRRGENAILIVDEAQGLSPASLEELRLLSNLQHEDRLLLQVFLVGQGGLLEMIRSPGMENLLQRFIATACLEPLDLDETVSYLEYRLCQVNWLGDPAISEEAIRIIHRFSGGIPRRINLIAHRLFLYGGMHQKHALTGEDARQVIEELRREHLLAAEMAALDLLEEDLIEEEGSASRSLPRAESFALARQQSKPDSGEHAADIAPQDSGGSADTLQSESRPVPEVDMQDSASGVASDTNTDTHQQSREHEGTVAGEEIVPDGRVAVGPESTDPGRSQVSVMIMAILAGLLLTVLVGNSFRDHLIGFVQVVMNKADHDPGGVPANLQKESSSPYDLEGAVSTTATQQFLSSVSPGSGAVQRDSVTEFRPAGSESVPAQDHGLVRFR